MKYLHEPTTKNRTANLAVYIIGAFIVGSILWTVFKPKPDFTWHEERKVAVVLNNTVIVKNVKITIYHPNFWECHSNKNITSDGESGRIGTCACSQQMFDWYVNYGDTVIVVGGSLAGKYRVNDKSGSRGFNIDIWQPCGSKKRDCYNSDIKIIH